MAWHHVCLLSWQLLEHASSSKAVGMARHGMAHPSYLSYPSYHSYPCPLLLNPHPLLPTSSPHWLKSTFFTLFSSQSLSELESTENPRYDPARNRSRSQSTASPLRAAKETSDLEEFKCITMKANTVEEGTRKDKKLMWSLRKSASDLCITGNPSLGGWLEALGLRHYESHFLRDGLDNVEIVSIACPLLYYVFMPFLLISSHSWPNIDWLINQLLNNQW